MIGKTISHYQILEKIGGGGMGVVYKAQDLRLERFVALKFLQPGFRQDPEMKTRFMHEAQTASALDHPGVCTIHDIMDTEQGETCIIMPLYEGETLRQILDRGPLPVAETLDYALKIADGLRAAHGKGIIHCDVKPANIIRTRDGNVKICDFGIARLRWEFQDTDSGSRIGTVAYMSPEQLGGGELDARTDIWSFGVLLYEMLAGHRPFTGKYTSALVYSIQNENPPPLEPIRTEIPVQLANVIKQCLAKNPAERPETMTEILEALRQIPESEKGIPWYGRRLTRRVVAPLVLLALLTFTLWYFWFRFESAISSEPVMQIGIMEFGVPKNNPAVQDWPEVIQMLLYDRLTGIPDLEIVEPMTMNRFVQGETSDGGESYRPHLLGAIQQTGITDLIHGSITHHDTVYSLKLLLSTLETGSIAHSSMVTLRSEEELAEKVFQLANELISYLMMKSHTMAGDEDLTPWYPQRSIHIGAIKEFLRAAQYIFNGMPGAEGPLRRALELDSNFVSARIWMISGIYQKGRIEEAKQEYGKLQRIYDTASPFEQAMIDWTGAFIRHDLPAQARHLKLALVYSPKNNILLYTLAGIKIRLEDYQGAIESILPTIEMRWHFSPAYSILIQCYHHLGDHANAKRVLKEALEIQPAYWDIYGYAAIYAVQDGDTVAAKEWDERYVQRGKEYGLGEGRIYYYLSRLYASDTLMEIAASHMKEALAFEPQNAIYYEELGEYYCALKHPEAESVLLDAVRLDSSRANAYFRLGEISDGRGNRQTAKRRFAKYLRLEPKGVYALRARQRLAELSR